MNTNKNNALAVALMSNATGKVLVAQAKTFLEDYPKRKAQLQKLMERADIPCRAKPGCTSKAERLGKALAFQGGAAYDEAVKLLTFAEFSAKSWGKAMDMFA